jgi:hypothetical protein
MAPLLRSRKLAPQHAPRTYRALEAFGERLLHLRMCEEPRILPA